MPRNRRRGRARRLGEAGGAGGPGGVKPATPTQRPRGAIINPYPPLEFANAEAIERIHNASLIVLQELGINFLHEEARDILAAAGAEVTPGSPLVRFDGAMVMEKMALAPGQFDLHARNPENSLTLGGNRIVVTTVGSPPNSNDIEGGRRSGVFTDYCDFLRLAQYFNVCEAVGGYPVEPTDIPPDLRHLKAVQAMVELTDKPLFGYSLGRRRILDVIEMARIACGLSKEELLETPCIFTVVNANSPRQYDVPMLIGIAEMARHGQPVVITPFTLAGAMAPVTVPGALVQQNAEALAGMVFAQCVRPGAPVMYGGFTSNVDMRTGAPAFGTPEYVQAVILGGQLARRYGVPYRSSNVNASNAADAQATWESMNSLWACFMSHANMIIHGLGWIEGGLSASFEKFIIDAEMVQMMAAMIQPISFDDDTLGLDAIREVEPGAHYFGAAHTLARFKTAFNVPLLADWRNFETWQEDGSQDATQRAHRMYREVLAQYEPPPMAADRREELNAFVERRLSEGGASADDL